jgi:hypothetical protein
LRRCVCNPAPRNFTMPHEDVTEHRPEGPARPRRRHSHKRDRVLPKGERYCSCGAPKRPMYLFCTDCYRSLPDELRAGLWTDSDGELIRGYRKAARFLRSEHKGNHGPQSKT